MLFHIYRYAKYGKGGQGYATEGAEETDVYFSLNIFYFKYFVHDTFYIDMIVKRESKRKLETYLVSFPYTKSTVIWQMTNNILLK